MRYEIKERYFDNDIAYSIWDNSINNWYMYGYGYMKGTRGAMQEHCNRLNDLQNKTK